MDTSSPAINMAIEKVLQHGNTVVEIERGWAKMKEVVYMEKPLDDVLRQSIREINSLYYSVYEGSPHDPPSERLIDKSLKVAILFPK